MELYGHTAKIALFSYAAADTKKIKNPSSPSALEQMFFHFFLKSGGFFQFFSLKITNVKNQICGSVWFKMEKPPDSVQNRNFDWMATNFSQLCAVP